MIQNSILDLVYNLPDNKWVDLMLYNPEIINSICLGIALELHVLENEKDSNNRRTLH